MNIYKKIKENQDFIQNNKHINKIMTSLIRYH